MSPRRERTSDITVVERSTVLACPSCTFRAAAGESPLYCHSCGDALRSQAVLVVTCGCTPGIRHQLETSRFCPQCGTGFAEALAAQGVLVGHEGK